MKAAEKKKSIKIIGLKPQNLGLKSREYSLSGHYLYSAKQIHSLMKPYLTLIRFPNLLMLIALQLILRYAFLAIQDVPSALTDLQYGLLILSTVCIAAGGYIINNILDRETDLINRPGSVVVGRTISEQAAYNWYLATNILGVGAGFYLANVIGKPSYAMIFIAIAGTLYIYSSSLKQSLLIGNIIVALISAMSVLIVAVFDLYPIISDENFHLMSLVFRVMLDFAIFCFIISFIREVVKDLEDVKGDYNTGMRTLPIVLGVSRTARLAAILGILPVAGLLYYTSRYYMDNELYYAAAFTLFLVVGPLLYFMIRGWQAKTTAHFRALSNVLKVVLLTGILSILVLSLNMLNHA